jgi:hypothetical protein
MPVSDRAFIRKKPVDWMRRENRRDEQLEGVAVDEFGRGTWMLSVEGVKDLGRLARADERHRGPCP